MDIHRRLPLWTLFGVAFLLLGAVPVLAWLQVRWLDRLHEAESQTIQSGLVAGMQSFQAAFDQELLELHFALLAATLEAPGAAEEDEATEGGELPGEDWLGSWRQHTDHPGFFEAVHYAQNEGGELKWWRVPESGPPTPQPLPPVAHDQYLAAGSPGFLFPVLVEDTLLIRLPATAKISDFTSHPHSPPNVSALSDHFFLLELDRQRLEERLIRPLAERHLPRWGDGFDFLILTPEEQPRIVAASRSDLTLADLGPGDAEVPILNFRSLRLNTFQEWLTKTHDDRPGDPLDLCGGLDSGPADNLDGGAASPSAGACDTEKIPTFAIFLPSYEEVDPWSVVASYRRGGLVQALAEARGRNLLISLLSLGVLALGAILLVFLVLRTQRLAQAQMDFVAGVSHELRTPLSVIHSAGENLEDGVVRSSDQVQRYGALLTRECRRLRELVDRVLTFAKLGNGSLEVEAVRLPDLVQRVTDDLRPDWQRVNLTIKTTWPADLPPVLAHRAALESVIQNLLSNAIKYAAEGREVEILGRPETRGTKQQVALEVRDRGPGIPKDEQRHLFEPFFRGDDARRRQAPGTGLGLSLVARVMKALHGEISLDPRWNPGCAFLLTLPAAMDGR